MLFVEDKRVCKIVIVWKSLCLAIFIGIGLLNVSLIAGYTSATRAMCSLFSLTNFGLIFRTPYIRILIFVFILGWCINSRVIYLGDLDTELYDVNVIFVADEIYFFIIECTKWLTGKNGIR